jgi:ATP synthase F1 complex assembly factor 2
MLRLLTTRIATRCSSTIISRPAASAHTLSRTVALPAARFHTSCTATAAANTTSSSSTSTAAASPAESTPLVAPAFGTNDDADRRFVYIKGVKNDGRSKRFYSAVTIQPVQTTRGQEFGVLLDGRFIVTPYNQILSAPNLSAAHAIAFEWDSQGDFLRPVSMPLTNICVTALDQAFTDRARFLTHFRGVMSTDSVFMKVKQPSGLVQQQRKQWEPLLQWMHQRYGCDLQTTFEFETPKQSDAAVARQRELLESLTGWQLAALDSLTTVTKSFVISWSVVTGRLSIHQAFEAARLEENFQMRQYGQVDGVYGHGIEMEFTRMTIAAAKTWINLVTADDNANPLLNPKK